MLIGYVRPSISQDNAAGQEQQLRDAGCEILFVESRSSRGGEQLENALGALQAGDTLVVTRADRLARSLVQLTSVAKRIQDLGASLMITEYNVHAHPGGADPFFSHLSLLADFEYSIKREGQMKGLARVRARGEKPGPKGGRIDADAVRAAVEAGEDPAAIARRFGISRSSIARLSKPKRGE